MADKQRFLKAINCTQCGAPLNIFGGGRRVESLTCGYCGSVLDAKQDYRVLKKFTEVRRPYLPLPLGRSGTIKGIEFSTIGVIEYRSDSDFSTWLEYLLYSPTHGYAWLEFESGHFIFSRRVRDLPDSRVVPVEKARFTARDHTFRVYDFYKATVTYVEGELTWVAEVGDRSRLIDAIAPPYGYSIEMTENETAYYFSEYLPQQDILSGFKLQEAPPEPYGVHGIQPYTPGAFVVGLVSAGKLFAPLALLLVVITFALGHGNEVFYGSIPAAEYLSDRGGTTRQFVLNDTSRLVQLELNANYNDAWGWFDIEVLKDQQPVFNMSKQISYYSGYEGGEHWSEGSRHASAYFKIDEPGTYSMHVWGEGGSGYNSKTPQRVSLNVTIREGMIVTRYFLGLLALSLLAWMSGLFSKAHFEALRWGDYEEDDE